VPLVSLDMKAITVEDVLRAVLEITLSLMVTHASHVLAANTQMQHQALVHLVPVIAQHVLRLLSAQVVTLDMDTQLGIVIHVLVELSQLVEPILAKHVLLVPGLTQRMISAQPVLKPMDVILVSRLRLVPSVKLDMKVITMEDVLHAMLENILRLVDLVFLALLVNGQIL